MFLIECYVFRLSLVERLDMRGVVVEESGCVVVGWVVGVVPRRIAATGVVRKKVTIIRARARNKPLRRDAAISADFWCWERANVFQRTFAPMEMAIHAAIVLL